MKQSREKHNPSYKAKVALEALKGGETVALGWPVGLRFTEPDTCLGEDPG